MRTKQNDTMLVEDIQAATADLQQVRSKMNFLIKLTPELEQESLAKGLGPTTMRQLEHRLLTAREHPEALPPAFDLRQFERDTQLTRALFDCHGQVQDMQKVLKETLLYVANRSVQAGNVVYGLIKVAVGPADSLKRTIKKPRLSRSRSRLVSPAPADAAPAPGSNNATPGSDASLPSTAAESIAVLAKPTAPQKTA